VLEEAHVGGLVCDVGGVCLVVSRCSAGSLGRSNNEAVVGQLSADEEVAAGQNAGRSRKERQSRVGE
jgi:hypothetical protein